MHSVSRKSERGVAMLIALFALLLLSVVGLGMMYSTNMETSINSNYRDKQGAVYAALAGLQEARDRIQPATHNIVAPTLLPANGAANIIYIVSDYSTVKPWDSSNAYFDTELCQEHVLGIPAGTPGVPCTTIASGTSWLSYVDDHASSSAPWNLTNPLDLKWTRISLKGNNMTPYPVNGSVSSTDQTCWTGTNQMSTPTGYTTGCQPIGGVTSISVITSGSGYSTVPTISFSGGAGSGAMATAVTTSVTTSNGVVTAISVSTGGTNYTSAPDVALVGGGGVGATAHASTHPTTIDNGYVDTVTLTAYGSGYTSAPTVSFSGGGGMGAAATINFSTGAPVTSLTSFTAGSKCYPMGSPPTVSFSPSGSTTAAQAHTVLGGSPSCVYAFSVTNNCTNPLNSHNGYSPIDQKSGVSIALGNRSFSGTLFVQSANDKTPLSGSACCTIENPGYDTSAYTAASPYSASSTLTLGASSWTDCGVGVNVTFGARVQSIVLDSGGAGYTSAPTVTFGNGSGTAVSGPSVTANIGNVGITGITLTDGGNSYTSAPTVSINGGGGMGAMATATIQTTHTVNRYVDAIIVDNGGANYTSAPTVQLTGGGGSGAAAVATVTTSSSTIYYVDHIDVTAGGSGYTSNPTVTINPTGGHGSGAVATSQISGGTRFGKVWLLTSMAQTRQGARSMLQMEVATPVLGFADGGALTLDGPSPQIDAMPNSMNFTITGADACTTNPQPDHPAIDGYDDPNASPPTHSVQTIIDSLPRPDHYTGSGGTPSVQNGHDSLGETMTTPDGLKWLIDQIKVAPGAHYYDSSNVGTFDPGSTVRSSITYVDGDLTLSGNGSGKGILVVTGTLHMSGNFTWYGLVLVVGDGVMEFNGGGNGQIVGQMWDAKIWNDRNHQDVLLSSLGQPTFHWNGGGGNGISYDHCWSTDLITSIGLTDPPPSRKPLKVLSLRILPY